MEVVFTNHALERMKKYDFPSTLVLESLENPDRIELSNNKRKIAQKRLNGYVLRVIYEENRNLYTIITVYRAKRERYEI
ncbi:MAG: DUF4258 domain-containing protein [Candidatus Diapherotrites archaeon]|uniref:DUF4258 domain-containing protein n=1 Tax=Candidatus Iainarchaeum sp. TaxID=3101447 RepID=A0A8T4L9E0_9ARCH|nr:DUF4258 domain-containing protein [Candidatus Diapherotrites archaeon]